MEGPHRARLEPMFDNLRKEAGKLGKPAWRPMLRYVVDLHERSVHPPEPPLGLAWEEIGPGYCYGPAFGHWDLVHAVLDTLPHEPRHARDQILNLLGTQEPDGLLPGVIWMRHEERPSTVDPKTGPEAVTHPPLWPVVVGEYFDITGDAEFVERCRARLLRQIGWFERHRRVARLSSPKSEPSGFFYRDVLDRRWESGIDEGVRFDAGPKDVSLRDVRLKDEAPRGPLACVDATSHVYALYTYAARWSSQGGAEETGINPVADGLASFIRESLFDEETGFFHDSWSVGRPEVRPCAFEGMWPVVVGAATDEQAQRAIDENLLNPERFLSRHPIATVGVKDRRFSLRMWRGPAWNSMTYWAAVGCMRYGRADAARRLLEGALDSSAEQFERTGTVWEFYHPHGGNPEDVARKPHTPYNAPCRDYLGHNPLCAMARLWEKTPG